MNNSVKKIAVCFTLLTLTTLLSPFAHGANKPVFYKVTKVIDGDTIQVQIGSKKEKVRLIGIDTPETVDPRKPVQCFGKEASQKAKKLMLNKEIRLEVDTTNSDRDKYNRLLRYVYLKEGTFINEYMVKEGYAFAYIQFPFQYMAEFKQYQSGAQSSGKGLWNTNSCPQKTSVTNEKKTGCTIKGNISSTIDEPAGEEWFCSEAEAVVAGWRKSKK